MEIVCTSVPPAAKVLVAISLVSSYITVGFICIGIWVVFEYIIQLDVCYVCICA